MCDNGISDSCMPHATVKYGAIILVIFAYLHFRELVILWLFARSRIWELSISMIGSAIVQYYIECFILSLNTAVYAAITLIEKRMRYLFPEWFQKENRQLCPSTHEITMSLLVKFPYLKLQKNSSHVLCVKSPGCCYVIICSWGHIGYRFRQRHAIYRCPSGLNEPFQGCF